VATVSAPHPVVRVTGLRFDWWLLRGTRPTGALEVAAGAGWGWPLSLQRHHSSGPLDVGHKLIKEPVPGKPNATLLSSLGSSVPLKEHYGSLIC